MIHVFYHRADLDGLCSAAIVNKFAKLRHGIPNAHFVGLDYHDDFDTAIDWDHLRGDVVYLVDFSLPIDLMRRFAAVDATLTWIDHHRTAIEAADAAGFNPKGLRDPAWSATELTWSWFTDLGAPYAVRMIGKYDTWRQGKHWPEVLSFQYGLRSRPERHAPTHVLWHELLSQDRSPLTDQISADGRAILRHLDEEATYAASELIHSTYIAGWPGPDGTRCHGVVALACNHAWHSSKLFDNYPHTPAADLFIVYSQRRDLRWKVSLYANSPDINVGDLARQHGGGGHQGAAGFTCDQLPNFIA